MGRHDRRGLSPGEEAVERELAILPTHDDKLVQFDHHRKIAIGMAEKLAKATPQQLREFVTLVVDRVVVCDRRVVGIDWKPEARLFMAAGE